MEQVELLLKRKDIDINLIDFSGRTPLHIAAEENFFHIGKLLIANKANVNLIGKYGKTALHCIAEENYYRKANQLEFAKLLLDKGSALEARMHDGQTALHVASNSYNWEMVMFLIEQGADINALDDDGSTALTSPVLDYNYEITQALIKVGADANISFLHETQIGYYSRYQTFLLHQIVSNIDMVKLLVQFGKVDVNSRNQYGMTPLHLCCDLQVMCFLLQNGGDYTLKDVFGRTPLDFARSVHDSKVICHYLQIVSLAMTLLSCREIARLGARSKFSALPFELIRQVILALI